MLVRVGHTSVALLSSDDMCSWFWKSKMSFKSVIRFISISPLCKSDACRKKIPWFDFNIYFFFLFFPSLSLDSCAPLIFQINPLFFLCFRYAMKIIDGSRLLGGSFVVVNSSIFSEVFLGGKGGEWKRYVVMLYLLDCLFLFSGIFIILMHVFYFIFL